MRAHATVPTHESVEHVEHTGQLEQPEQLEPTEHVGRTAKPFARHVPTVARLLLGLVFLLSGLFGVLMVLGLVPMPQPSTPLSEGAAALFGAMMKTGYLFALIKGTELVGGALLLSNRFVPLALVVLAPVVVNIVAFHAFLAPSGVGLALVLAALEAYLAWVHREAYAPLLAARTTPRAR